MFYEIRSNLIVQYSESSNFIHNNSKLVKFMVWLPGGLLFGYRGGSPRQTYIFCCTLCDGCPNVHFFLYIGKNVQFFLYIVMPGAQLYVSPGNVQFFWYTYTFFCTLFFMHPDTSQLESPGIYIYIYICVSPAGPPPPPR